MTIEFKNRNGSLLAEVDSDTITSDRIKATLHACSICKQTPFMGRDNGRWYLVGAENCESCRGVYPMPDEGELSDAIKRSQ